MRTEIMTNVTEPYSSDKLPFQIYNFLAFYLLIDKSQEMKLLLNICEKLNYDNVRLIRSKTYEK